MSAVDQVVSSVEVGARPAMSVNCWVVNWFRVLNGGSANPEYTEVGPTWFPAIGSSQSVKRKS